MSDPIACGDDAPAILPFSSKMLEAEQALPRPVARFHNYFLIDGIPVHAIGERWRAEDADQLDFPTYPVLAEPSLVYSLRLEAEGVVIRCVSRAAYHAATATRPRPGISPSGARLPRPVAACHSYFIVDGLPVHAVGQRWRAKDAGRLDFPTYPIPTAASLVYSFQLETTGVVTTISAAEYDRLAASARNRLPAMVSRLGS